MTITLKDGRKALYQWDTGRYVVFDCETVGQAQFANNKYGNTIDVEIKNGEARIPDELLQTGRPLRVYAVAIDTDGQQTVLERTFTVTPRNRPAGYVVPSGGTVDVDKDDALQALVETDTIQPLADADGAILTDKNGDIISIH